MIFLHNVIIYYLNLLAIIKMIYLEKSNYPLRQADNGVVYIAKRCYKDQPGNLYVGLSNRYKWKNRLQRTW